MTNFEKVRRYRKARAVDQARRAYESLDIFLAGPYVNVDESHDAKDNSETTAKSLRYYLFGALEELGHVVYLGEDVEMRLNGEANFGKHANAVVYERHYIKQHIDAIIALPSSPGSFCELGDWVSDKGICDNMLIVIDAKYEGNLNYINEGMARFAISNNATVHYLDYADHPTIFAKCQEFLAEVAQKAELEKLYGRR